MRSVRWGTFVLTGLVLAACGGAPIQTDRTGAESENGPAAVSVPEKT